MGTQSTPFRDRVLYGPGSCSRKHEQDPAAIDLDLGELLAVVRSAAISGIR